MIARCGSRSGDRRGQLPGRLPIAAIAFFAISMATALLVASDAPADPGRPNVLLISLDTVRADYLSFGDAAASPRMTELAGRGTVFTQAVSSSSWTLPTHVQMFTGTPPPLHGVESDFERIDPLMPTLPELLKAGGYFTAGVFTAHYLWGDYGFSRGFDVYRSAIFEEDLKRPDLHLAPRGQEALKRARRVLEGEFINSPLVLAPVRNALERAGPEQPIFVFAHFFDPHPDYIPPEPWGTRFDPDYAGEIDGRHYIYNKRIYDRTKQPPRQIADRDLEHIKALYRGEIGWTDRWVGELLDLFALHGRLDDTLVVITSDHGEEFFEHGHHFHRRALYDESIRIPLLIVPPEALRVGLTPQVDAQVGLSDILPTILDFAQIDAPATVAGRSLQRALYGDKLEDRAEILSIYSPFGSGRSHPAHNLYQGIRTPSFKFLRRLSFAPDRPPEVELHYFDLVEDPGEQSPVVDPEDVRIRGAWRALEDELDALRARFREQPHSPDAERRTDVRGTLEEALLALGYIEAGGEDAQAGAMPRPWGSLAPIPRVSFPTGEAEESSNHLPLVGVAFAAIGLLAFWWLRRRAG